MTLDLWPCSTCGAPGLINLGTKGYCSTHASELLRTFNPAAFQMRGRWLQTSCLRPDHGPAFAECECPACGATAVAVIGTPCAYCEHAVNRLNQWRAESVLRPDLPSRDDPSFNGAVSAWLDRLAVAVQAGIVTEDEARSTVNHLSAMEVMRDEAA